MKKKAVSGLILVSASTYFWKIVDFICTIILARILTPEDFGVVSTALFVLFFVMMFPGFGTGQALIQRKTDVKKAADTVFVMAPFLSILMIAILYFAAPVIAEFYSAPALTGMLRALSVAVFFSALGLVPASLMEKELDYKKRVIPEIISPVLMSIVSVILAFRGFGAWSIIIGYIVLYASSSMGIWLFSSYRPSLSFDFETAKELFMFGKNVVMYYSVTYFISYLSYGIVAKVLGLAIVGYFAIADKFSTLVIKNITKIINRVTFPVYSMLQEKKEELRSHFVKVLEYTSFFVVPANMGIFILAPEIIRIVYGEKWMPAVDILRIVIFSGILLGIAGTTNSVFFSLGKHRVLTQINLLQMILLLTMLYPAARFMGITGVALLVVVSSAINFTMSFINMRIMLGIDLRELSKDFMFIIVSSIAMSLALAIIKEFIVIDSILMLGMAVALGLLCYVAVSYFLNKRFYKSLVKELFSYIEK